MKFIPVKLAVFILVSLSLVLCSCWAYSFSASALKGANSIAIKPIENNTAEFGLEELLYENMVDQFETDNVLKVVPESQADLIMDVTIDNYSHEASDYDESYTVTEYACTIILDMKISYRKSEDILWEDKALSDFGIYSPQDGENQDDGNERAVDKIVTEIMNRTVRDW